MTQLHEEMSIVSVISKYPQTIPVMLDYGIQCIGCRHAEYESLREACRCNGIADSKRFLTDLNKAIASIPPQEEIEPRILCYEHDSNDEQEFAA
ncbi:MAG: DUF1858 domain-containing protein [bacterium]|nr:DUF1858 domain-containing protein [bacterium]